MEIDIEDFPGARVSEDMMKLNAGNANVGKTASRIICYYRKALLQPE